MKNTLTVAADWNSITVRVNGDVTLHTSYMREAVGHVCDHLGTYSEDFQDSLFESIKDREILEFEFAE